MRVAKRFIPHYTIEDYKRWEGDWELIEGIPVAMSPSPGFTHQRISSLIHWQLMNLLKECRECIVLYEIDWIIKEDTVVRPDIVVLCKKPSGEYITEPPLMIFEIVSEQTAFKDEGIKFKIYEEEGVPFYLLVYPAGHVRVYKHNGRNYEMVGDFTNQSVEFHIGDCQFLFDFSVIW